MNDISLCSFVPGCLHSSADVRETQTHEPEALIHETQSLGVFISLRSERHP